MVVFLFCFDEDVFSLKTENLMIHATMQEVPFSCDLNTTYILEKIDVEMFGINLTFSNSYLSRCGPFAEFASSASISVSCKPSRRVRDKLSTNDSLAIQHLCRLP